MIDRTRKVDLNKMTREQADMIQDTLSLKMNEIVQKAIADANKYLNVYGIQAKMLIELNQIEEDTKTEAALEKPKKLKKRKGKETKVGK